jgi:glucokinase
MKLYMDVGGTTIRTELHTHDTIINNAYTSRDHELYDLIVSLLKRYPDIRFIGIAYAGMIDQGCIISAPNIEVKIHDIKQRTEQIFGIRVEIENDVNCAVLAEAHDHTSRDIVALYVGTGLGCGVVSNGHLLHGYDSLAAEIGHIPYKSTPFLCGCGKDNCIELYASGSGMLKWKQYHNLKDPPDLLQLRHSDKQVERDIAKRFESALLTAAGTMVTLFNPETLVLGGGIVSSNPYLVEMVTEQIQGYALPEAAKRLSIVQTRLKDAPLEGTKYLEEVQ